MASSTDPAVAGWHHRSARTTAWPYRTGTAGCAALIVGEALWLTRGLPDGALVSDLVAMTVASWAAISCAVAAHRYPAASRRLWILMAVTMALATTGRIAWTAGRLASDGLPHTPTIGALFVAGMISGTAALLSCRPAVPGTVGLARPVLDGLIVGLALVPAGWLIVFRAVTTSTMSDQARTVGLLFPMLDLIQLAILVAVTARARPMWLPMTVIGASITLRAVADTVYIAQVAQAGYYPGHPMDVCWPLSYLLVAAAAGTTPHHGIDGTDDGVVADKGPPWLVLLPYLPVGGAIVAMVLSVRQSGRLPTPVLVTGMALLATLAIRQSLAVHENNRLVARMRRLAYQDQLTGLPNRLFFSRRLQQAIAAHRRVTVLLLDLDGFKQVNDRFGHAAGDELLTSVADRMRRAVDSDAMVARVGGDEFAVLVDSDTADRPEALAQRLLAAVRPTADGDDPALHSSASVGIAEYAPHHTGHADLLRDADIAMYAAKAAGKSAYRTCTPALREAAVTRAELIADLRRAVDEGGQLELAFQPIVELPTGVVRGAEALLRWRHPRRGLLTPDRFLPLAEETGLIVPMDRWVLNEACRSAAAWRVEAPRMTVAVNIASMHLHRMDVAAAVTAATSAAGLAPDALTLELTETALIDDTETVLDRLRQLREIGVRIAIDDFGTGYSSLSYLHRIPATDLKIDRSFVSRIGDGGPAYATVEMIARLAAAFELVVVAEGVETDSQHRAVTAIGCPRGQGYLYGRPRSLAELRGTG